MVSEVPIYITEMHFTAFSKAFHAHLETHFIISIDFSSLFSRGGFKFDVATQQMFYGGFQAQLPCRVHRKAYESSRKIPLILQVKLLPQCDIWEDLFQDSCPDFCDIALYFFPSANIERYIVFGI